MKKLRREFVVAVFLSVTLVFVLSIAVTSLWMVRSNNHSADIITKILVKNKGDFPIVDRNGTPEEKELIDLYHLTEESPYRYRYFVVFLKNGEVNDLDFSHIVSVDVDYATEATKKVLHHRSDTGFYDDYRYRVSEDKSMVVFLDVSMEIASEKTLLTIMGIVAAAFIALITIVFGFVSKRVVRPFEENSRMQKQFITDASHELKTPVAIISANAEVLSYKYGESEWIDNITTQTERIAGLVNELLTLNRLEEIENNVDISPVNLSEILNRTADEFSEVFSGKNVTVTREIPADLTINGNPDQLTRLVSVLVENASKYVTEGGEVRLSLKKDLRNVTMTIFNTAELDENADYSHLFDRFYRPDQSRTSKTGGHGIGLSIARRIAVLHNGSIQAIPEKDGLAFRVKLSTRLKSGNKKKL